MKKVYFFLGILLGSIMLSCDNTEDVKVVKESAATLQMKFGANLDADLMLELVNEVRAKGCECEDKDGTVAKMPAVPPLVWSTPLTIASKRHSEDMAVNSYFSHDNLKKKTVGDRVKETGYTWMEVFENIAKGQKNEREVFDGWIKSYPNCKNIMDSKIREVGAARSKSDLPYWTMVFASERRE